ncbi:MAG: undecaprenyldiphospho-muramoylpentapeptide beta-N-acetylglucosaminyltransferase [Candidatus Bipolaricaulota bacterium]|nr:undecaprenyldiphospho-muramoylpentapeptide beta-N-acetylglucosaminyltransferase [Candidatus Bipolaricaulota bacterium]MDW8126493.1 undecaprenyldiphospho-muramoylpentapeptide beta-N-acetylglucosaminyltransferase [Candidatus Bipolaricaulota bacterium]
MRVLLAAGGSGGHVFPALAVAEELHGEGEHRLAWIGNPHGLEAQVVEKRPWIEFFPLVTRGLARDRPWSWPKALLQQGQAVFQAKRFIRKFQPDVVLVMGGYPSVAPALAAKRLGIPVVLHEQNAVMGLANRFLASLADLVLLAFPQTEHCPRGAKTRVTGTPVRAGITRIPPRLGQEFLVLGGSLGSRRLLEAVMAMGPELSQLPNCHVRLVIGRAGNPHAIARPLQQQGIPVEVHTFTERVEEFLERARLVLARAGGSTVAELACAGRPAILVPWEKAAGGHQLKNAEFLAQRGGFLLVREKELVDGNLSALVHALWGNEQRLQELGRAARAQARPDAARRVVEALKSLGKERS